MSRGRIVNINGSFVRMVTSFESWGSCVVSPTYVKSKLSKIFTIVTFICSKAYF